MGMSHHPASAPSDAPVSLNGFDVLDFCHRQTLFALGRLAALIARLENRGADDEGREMAAEIVRYFSTTARTHHEDEERHLFPKLLAEGDAQVVEAVLRLKQDHGWLEVDWAELEPHLEALAAGRSGCDIDVLREGAEIFTALSYEHIALEESCIYPQARSRLAAADRQEMGREMAARRLARRSPHANPSDPV